MGVSAGVKDCGGVVLALVFEVIFINCTGLNFASDEEDFSKCSLVGGSGSRIIFVSEPMRRFRY